MTRIFSLLLSATILCGTASAQGFNYAAYEPISLASAFAAHEIDITAEKPGSHIYIDAGLIKYAVVVTYTGQHREISSPRKEVVSYWAQTMHHEGLFGQEIEVQSGEKKYWLPIQNALVQPLVSEMHAGGTIKLYIVLIGGTNASSVSTVFGINEFASVREQSN